MKLLFSLLLLGILALSAFAQMPKIEPGVSHDLAVWRAAHYSDIRYKLNLTIEKMSPVLKGTMEVRVNVSEPPASAGGRLANQATPPIILDWRRLRGHEKDSGIANVTINGRTALFDRPKMTDDGVSRYYAELDEHLIFYENVIPGENVIKLDFTSPILTSGSAITRYIDKEDGSEYIYSILSPSNASTAFPMFDQPDLKARFRLTTKAPFGWKIMSNTDAEHVTNLDDGVKKGEDEAADEFLKLSSGNSITEFKETEPINTNMFALAAGEFSAFYESDFSKQLSRFKFPRKRIKGVFKTRGITFMTLIEIDEGCQIFLRNSQAEEFRAHAASLFRQMRKGNKYFSDKTGWPKYDLVLIADLPSEVIQAGGITFVRESSIIGNK